MAQKERLDTLLVEKNLISSRERAKALIMAGDVLVDGIPETKPGVKIDITAELKVKVPEIPYVSRGGLKLEKALRDFNILIKDQIGLDIGASTGGFTDCMLQFGAKKVYSIDVGYGQFAWKLRQDPRVVCMERTNIRYVTSEDIGEYADFASIDVSFISLTKVLPAVINLLIPEGKIIALIKPQFEAGREKVGKKGVVRDPKVHEEVIHKIVQFGIENNLSVEELSFSPIKGPEGNIEYLAYFKKGSFEHNMEECIPVIQKVVHEAHEGLVV